MHILKPETSVFVLISWCCSVLCWSEIHFHPDIRCFIVYQEQNADDSPPEPSIHSFIDPFINSLLNTDRGVCSRALVNITWLNFTLVPVLNHRFRRVQIVFRWLLHESEALKDRKSSRGSAVTSGMLSNRTRDRANDACVTLLRTGCGSQLFLTTLTC